MRQLFRSIRSRITWPVIAVLVICFLFLGSQLLQVRDELLESLVITEYVEYYEGLISTIHNDKLVLLEETIKSMTSNVYFAQSLGHKRATVVSEVLQDVGSNFASSGLAGLIAVDKNNAMVAEYRNKPFDFKESTVPFSAIQHSSEGLNYVAAIPVVWQGEDIGAVYGVYSLADIITELQDKTVAEDVFIYSFSDIIYAGTAENDEYAISNTSISEVLAGTVTYELGERGKELRLLLPLRDDEESVVGFIKVIFDIALYQDVFLEAKKSVMFTFVGTLLLLAVALQFILGFILKPVKEVVAISGELRKGSLYARVTSPTNDEIGSIARAFNNMGESFEAVIINLKHSVSELLSSLQTIALASEQVAAGSQQQAQGTSSILDMSHKIAGAADSISTQAISTTTLVNNIMDSAIDGKQSLAVALRVTNEVEEKVSTLREQSARIAEISALIKDISYQTSLLSLNAAIEAARAGEAGRGFAVVADEVRKLAESTAEATQDIDKLIRSTEEQIARVAESTGELQSANTGVVAHFESIVEGLQSGAVAVQDIAQMVAAQAEFSRQVTIAVESVAAVVEENSAAVEENAGMISEMRKLAQSIGKLTDAFKTKK